jgi:hypothetical protein
MSSHPSLFERARDDREVLVAEPLVDDPIGRWVHAGRR